MIMGNYLWTEPEGIAVMSQRPPMGIHHLTVVPENAASDAETALGTDETGEQAPRAPRSSSD